jgi:hypothetical protein
MGDFGWAGLLGRAGSAGQLRRPAGYGRKRASPTGNRPALLIQTPIYIPLPPGLGLGGLF